MALYYKICIRWATVPQGSCRWATFDLTLLSPVCVCVCLLTPAAQQSSEGGTPVEHLSVFGSTSGSVRSTSPSVQNITHSQFQPISSQATAFVQPTQQQQAPPTAEPASQEAEAGPSGQVERPSTSTAVFGSAIATGGSAGPKRAREVELEARAESADMALESPDEPPIPKKLRIIQRVGLEEENEEGTDGEAEGSGENQETPDGSQVNLKT